MAVLNSYIRVVNKMYKFADIFGYMLISPIVPDAILEGPQEESDAFEIKLDKCIADKVDYFAEEFGYDPETEREEVKRNQYIFVD